MKIALYSTFYPACIPFVQQWAQGVLAQDDRNFDLHLALQGVSVDEVTACLDEGIRFTPWPVESTLTPAQVRCHVWKQICPDYDAIAMIDSDDIMLPACIPLHREGLKKSDLSAFAMTIITEDGTQTNMTLTSQWDNVFDFNTFGLSNTAYATSFLKSATHNVPPECRLLDWYLAMQYALSKRPAPAISTSVGALYRQYANNTAPLLKPLSARHIAHSLDLVRHHFKIITENGTNLPASMVTDFQSRIMQLDKLSESIATSGKKDKYIQELNKTDFPLAWWSFLDTRIDLNKANV